VNTILDKLDDKVETVAEDASNILVDSDGVPSNFTSRFLGQKQSMSESDEESYYDDDEEYEEYEDIDPEPVQNYDPPDSVVTGPPSIQNDSQEPEITTQPTAIREEITPSLGQKEGSGQDFGEAVALAEKSEESDLLTNPKVVSATDNVKEVMMKEATSNRPAQPAVAMKAPPSAAPVVNTPPSSVERRPPQAPRSQTSNVGSTTKSSQHRAELQKLQQELQKMTKQNGALQNQLDAAQTEINAQQKELEQAAERLEEDRQLADEEREDLLDEHEDALRNLKESYETRLEVQKQEYESKLGDVKQKLATEAHMRVQEGGDMTEELEEALEREREALQKADQLQQEKNALEASNLKYKNQEETLREKMKNLSEAAQTAAERERQAEERLDNVNEAHQRALSNRQAREAELERTVTELGAALASKGAERKLNGVENIVPGGDTVHQRQHDMVVEELESTKGQLDLSNQRCEALQTELKILSKERTDEASAAQHKQREYDQRVEDLTSKIARLEASVREYKVMANDSITATSSPLEANPNSLNGTQDNMAVRQVTRDLDKARRQIATLSDQLLRQQGLTESAKSEVLALRGRLQSATTRAEAAEQASAESHSNTGRLYELESGGVGYGVNPRIARKRVKMGRGQQRGGRTMRSALGLNTSENSSLDQVAQTVDALDLWMLETGNIMKHEPLARLGLLVYLLVVHLWCFGLVCFHAVESEHGDLGSLTARRAVLDMAHHNNP